MVLSYSYAERLANSIDPGQTNLVLHCLLSSTCPKTLDFFTPFYHKQESVWFVLIDFSLKWTKSLLQKIKLQVFNRTIGFILLILWKYYMSPVKRICVFEHFIMTNFNCACPAIQRGKGSGFLSEGSSWLTACMSEQRRFWRDCADVQARLNLRCSHRQ